MTYIHIYVYIYAFTCTLNLISRVLRIRIEKKISQLRCLMWRKFDEKALCSLELRVAVFPVTVISKKAFVRS